MSENSKRLLEKQLWGVANVLRGKMNADEYKNYILGFIFYKYLSEKLEKYINSKLLSTEDYEFSGLDEASVEGQAGNPSRSKEGLCGSPGIFLETN